MRHDLLLAPPLTVAGRPPRMREATGPAALVAPAGFAQRLASRRARAVAPAVALAAVAAAAHQHRGAAARAGERPCAALRLALPCTMHARLAVLRARVPAGAWAAWTRHLRRVPYCARTRGQHEWGAAARTTGWSLRSPRPSCRRSSTASSPSSLPQHRGLGGQPPVQAFVDHASQRQRSVRADTVVRVIRPRAPHGGSCAPSTPHLSLRRVSSGEQGRVNSRERQGPDQLNGAPALKKSLLPARQRLFLGSESAWFLPK